LSPCRRMAEQCTVSIEASKQQQEQPVTTTLAAAAAAASSHPASPLSCIKSPTCAATTGATTHHHEDEGRGSALLHTVEEDGGSSNDGSSTPRTTCDHRSASGVTPLSLAGDAGGKDGGAKKPYWLFASAGCEEDRAVERRQQHHHQLLRLDSNGSDDIDGSLRHEPERQPLECPILLETPALERAELNGDEDDDVGGGDAMRRQGTTDGMMSESGRISVVGKLAIISDKLAAVKPKRLSDEFFSADDDNDDEEEDDVDDEETKSNGDRCMTDRPTAMVDSEAQASLSEIKNLSITCCGKRKEEEPKEKEEGVVCEQNRRSSLHASGSKVDATDPLLPACRDALLQQPKASVLRAAENTIEDDDPLEQEGQQQQQHDAAAAAVDEDEELLLDDVQSMDAIERRDFEQEGGFLIRNRSLISGDRLNLEFLNNTNARPASNERRPAEQQPSYSLYSAASAAGVGTGTGDDDETAPAMVTDAAAATPALPEECKPAAELAEAFLNANSNDSVSSGRSLFGVHGTEVEESAITAVDVHTKEEEEEHTHKHHDDPCCSSTSSTASYSSSSSPLPSQTATAQHAEDVSMSICSSAALPPTASHSASSCAFPKDDARMSLPDGSKQLSLLPSTSSNGRADSGQPDEHDGASKGGRASGTGHQSQHSQHHHRRQLHHHHQHQRASGAGGEGTVDASIGSSSSSTSRAANSGGGGTAPAGSAVVASAGPEVVVASYHQQRDASTNTSNSPEPSEPEIDEEDWADCEEGTDEEVCTCRDYTDEDGFASSEDELPSRDVDLSSYTHLDTISDDLLHDAQTPRLHRKRKLTENRTILYGEAGSPSAESLNYSSRKRLALDGSSASATASSTAAGSASPGAAGAAGTSATTTSTTTTSASAVTTTPLSSGVVATTPRSSLRSPMNIATTPTSSTLGERKTPRTIIPTKDNPPPELCEWLMQFQRWTHVERLLAVDRLIEHCEPTQVRHMMKVIEPQFQRDFISLLPKELALQVLSYLEPKDLLRAAQTCRSWRFLADDNLLWKEKCKESGIGIEPSTDRPKRGRTGNMPPISSPWKAAYMRQHIIEMNWRSRPIRTAKVLKGHDDHVITCLQFCGNRIVSGSDDNTLKVWSAITGKCLRTLTGHTGGVWSSQMSGNIIISGSTDRTLRVWKADTGQCMHILHGHTSTVRCMHLHGNKVVSGSRDATLRVWDVNLGTCLHMLVGHLAAVRCVQYDGKLIVSGAYDYMVKVWNPERQECLHTLQGHTNRVYSLQFDGIHVVSGSLDTSIRVWDAETGSCKHALMGHQSLTSGMELRQNILVSGNADSTVKVWDIITGQCLQTLSGPNKHQSAVTCLQFNSRFVITSSDDGTVKLWDVKTGEFIRNLVLLESGGSGGVVWRIRANDTKLICAVGSRNGTEETKLMVLDFDVEGACLKCS
uniref:F-box/WD repeat-containing protein 7 n=1 Tax=Anopheles coluzzii TaxID=1518534 RepID=A0A8W7PAS8_ANOCL